MKSVFVLFDSLNRAALGAYGGTTVKTPNFDRFAKRAMTFDRHYVGSLPCMPARRDMHSGRLNFTHRSWGPLEPFDNSFAQILGDAGVYTHLITDHLHYFEDGGSGYHTRFNTWEFIRGQEHDPWVAMVEPPVDRFRETYSDKNYPFDRSDKRFQGMINREVIREERDFPGPQCFDAGLAFLDRNRAAQDWLLMIECFDPHEPFHAPEPYRDAYESGYEGPILDWPRYAEVTESDTEIAEIRANYAALLAMCDAHFGRLLDYFDEHDLWADTALVLSTDHGFLLSEHDWWGKMRTPYYEEISHIPLMIHDPRAPQAAGRRSEALTQTADLMPTLLGLNGVAVPAEVRGRDLHDTVAGRDKIGRDVAVFGVFGGPLGVTDGRYSYYHYPPDLYAEGLREYTLMPTHMDTFFTAEELRTATLSPGFDFTRGAPVLSIAALPGAKRVPMNDGLAFGDVGTRLFDISKDPEQQQPLDDPAVAERLMRGAVAVLEDLDTPQEVYGWYGIETYRTHAREEPHATVT
ncbi:sulfatase [Sulfitobacter sp. D35]|uniref:sulfatase n=1 Tax=Sulfitobacter sp. D35 TaxID=3083252 RepID=UPI00296E7B39|nr:sulfatase [Sulfitobacter sp. D35]MDW4499348.1 sulfatase [Sulfitobacter sp. D35]